VDLLWVCYSLIILYKMASADDMDDELLACSSVYVASAAGIMYLYASQKSRLKKRKHTVCIESDINCASDHSMEHTRV